jgi:hypothetical protein
MIELNAYKNLNTASKTYGQWYVRKESKQVYGLSELAQHIDFYRKITPIQNIIVILQSKI